MITGLDRGAEDLYLTLQGQLAGLRVYLDRQSGYYEGTAPINNLGIAVPEAKADIGTAVGWPATVVDILAERVGWRGWSGVDGLDAVAAESLASFEFSQMMRESLIFGQGFIEVTPGGEDGPEVSIQAVPAKATTGVWNAQKRILDAGYSSWTNLEGRWERLYLPDETVTVLDGEVVDRWGHGFGRPTLVRHVNRILPHQTGGRSEISREIRYCTDAAARTLMQMEIAREFYTKPQHYAINMQPEDFGIDPDAPAAVRRMQGWNAVMGTMLVAPPSPTGDTPSLGQFQSQGPTSFWESVRGLSQLCAAAAGMPESYFGFVSDNPTSADAIRAGEARLIKRAESKIALGSWASREVARLALMVLGGYDPATFTALRTEWEDPATPTKAAAADAATKLVGAGILPAGSKVTRDFVGLTSQQQNELAEELRADTAARVIGLVQERPLVPEAAAMLDQTADGEGQPTGQKPVSEAADLKQRFDALGVAIQSGVKPEAAARMLGLNGVEFTGAMPVALRPLED